MHTCTWMKVLETGNLAILTWILSKTITVTLPLIYCTKVVLNSVFNLKMKKPDSSCRFLTINPNFNFPPFPEKKKSIHFDGTIAMCRVCSVHCAICPNISLRWKVLSFVSFCFLRFSHVFPIANRNSQWKTFNESQNGFSFEKYFLWERF